MLCYTLLLQSICHCKKQNDSVQKKSMFVVKTNASLQKNPWQWQNRGYRLPWRFPVCDESVARSRSCESNDPYEVKRCHCMKSLRNILCPSYGGERDKFDTNWIVQLTCQVPCTPSKVTWIQWPLWGEKVSLHEKLKEHLVLKLWWWTGQVCYKLNCTAHLSSATPPKVTWIQWPIWGEKVSLHVHEKLKEHLVLKLWWWTGQVCYKLNCTTHLSSATPSKVTWIQWPLWGEKVSLHEKLKEHLVLRLWWWTGQVCYKLNCTTHLSSATPPKVTWIQWPLWGEIVSLHEKLKEHLVLNLWWWTRQVCYKLNVQLTCQVPRPPRSRESNDPFEEKRCHYMKSLRNILSSGYGGERGKCATNWIVQLTCQVPRPPRSRESNDPFEVKRCHCMKSLRNILSSSYVVNGASVLQIECTTHLSSATPPKVTWIQWPLWGEKVSLHEKLKEHLVLRLWWWMRPVCYKLNCTTHLSSATPSKVTWIQWPLWGEKVSLHEKLKEHLVLKLWWWTGQVCYKLNCTTHLSSATPSKVTWI